MHLFVFNKTILTNRESTFLLLVDDVVTGEPGMRFSTSKSAMVLPQTSIMFPLDDLSQVEELSQRLSSHFTYVLYLP